MSGFPRSEQEITPEWLTSVLRNAGVLLGESVVSSVDVQPVGGGFGQTSETMRLWLSTEPPAAAGNAETMSLIAKFVTRDERRRGAARRAHLYRTEVNFYRTIAPQIGTRVPRCYLAEIDGETECFMLLLEDFRDHRPGDEVVGLGLSDARLAITELARLHAPFWNNPRNYELAGKPAQLPASALAEGWDIMVDTFGDDIPAPIQASRHEYLASAPALHDWVSHGETTTIVHGDFRLDNLMFGGSSAPHSDRLIVLDWQGVSIRKGINDFAYLISHSMPVEQRREFELPLLRQYVDELAANGVHYDEEQALLDYRIAMVYLIQFVIWITGVHINSNERAIKRKRALLSRAFTAIIDHDALALLPAIDQG